MLWDYCVNLLDYLENTHYGAREEIAEKGHSVPRNTFGIGQPVDLAGEQSYMKSAKAAGGITQFDSKSNNRR